MTIQFETGHTPNEAYMDRQGNLHLNGAALWIDETASLISAATAVIPSSVIAYTSLGTVAATGTTQADAAALTNGTNVVTGANGTAGVQLPAPSYVGQEVAVINTAASGLKVYADNGGTGGTVNGGASNAAATLAASKGATYVCTAMNPSAWWSMSN